MSEFANVLYRQAVINTITKKAVDKCYALKKITKAEYDTICEIWANKKAPKKVSK